MIQMVGNYKHCFFGPGLLPVLLSGGLEEGRGGFYYMILKKLRVCNKNLRFDMRKVNNTCDEVNGGGRQFVGKNKGEKKTMIQC